MKKMFIYSIILVSLLILNVSAQKSFPTISDLTKDLHKQPGFINYYWDDIDGKIWLEIDSLNEEYIFQVSLPRGIGSNDIGLDRGQLGSTRVVQFEKHGPKIILVQKNLKYRAETENESEQKAVEESFAKSVLFGFNIAASERNKYLVDGTQFFMQDANNITGIISSTNQGNYSLDASKSAFFLENTKNFPFNTEVEVILTFAGSDPGGYVRSIVPTPELITIHQRYSFIQLPDDNFKPRKSDPRTGYFGISYYDYAAPLDQPIEKRYISKHRLDKKNPSAAISEPIEPIIYYVDSGAPEPVKSALIEGANWWNKAFEAAGYKNAFQVKVLPKDADPMDVRYNIIQWVHRSTRGWSYGDGVIDPRTGEIIKGHVTLGSLRIRQDYLIAEGLLAPYADENSESDAMKEMSLARIRQLSAHEVGHTLGLSHNFAASSYGRESVMDYPHPYVKLRDDGTFDFSEAYDDKIGSWDKLAIEYGYQDFEDGVDEENALEEIINKGIDNNLLYIGDIHSRPASAMHPNASLWDNGSSAVDELNRIMKVRAAALNNFSERVIKFGEPYSKIEDVLVPVYLMHRYQVEAAAKVLGGSYFTYRIRGDKLNAVEIAPAEDQLKALDEILETLTPENLAIPKRILKIIPPKAEGYSRTRENFQSYTNPGFDPIAAAEASAEQTLSLIFNKQRCARILENNLLNENYPSLNFVLEQVISKSWKENYDNEYYNGINRMVRNTVLQYLFRLAGTKNTLTEVNAVALLKIGQLEEWIAKKINADLNENEKAHFSHSLNQIKLFMEDPAEYQLEEPVKIPDGSPIGCGY